eukprot:TRINITY_DN2067_c0_g1_i41.p1 TRINITY_DN2067_c0_g1~~TRINITY_DN2067_c0_g1_i41.p1  ORF type:complete len:306 (-),score=75.31 TRINITY_DN2067_c0_g1_i41:918-1835(-)
MAKFRTSNAEAVDDASPRLVLAGTSNVADRSIGDIIRQAKNLSDGQVETILQYQREHGVRFGEAAIALGFASADEILAALSQQFHYPYASEGKTGNFSQDLVVAHAPFSKQAEAFRAIRSQLTMRAFSGDVARRALAVISPDSGDGKSFFCSNLAVALSQLGGRTLLVDADLRGPRQHEVFGIENGAGLSGLLAGRAEANVIQQVNDLPSLYVLPVGNIPPNPLELVERPAFGLLIAEFISKFDHVIVDTPAAALGSDAAVIAMKCGSALVVARKGQSRLASLQQLVGSLSGTQISLAGVIMNEY